MASRLMGKNTVEGMSHLERYLALWLLVVVLMGGLLGFCMHDLVAVSQPPVSPSRSTT